MKFFVSAIVAFASITLPVRAQEYNEYKILPNLYASTYCALRRSGVAKQDAMDAAITESMIKERVRTVLVNGRRVGSDVVIAARTAINLCPDLF